MSYRHRKGNRERPLVIVPVEGGYFCSYNGKRHPIRIYKSGRFEDDYLPKWLGRVGSSMEPVTAILRGIYGHGPQFKHRY